MGPVYFRDKLICCLDWGKEKKVLADDFLLIPPAEADICFPALIGF